MEQENEIPVIMECAASYSLREDDGQEIGRGTATLYLDTEKLTVLPESGEPLLIPYRDIVQIGAANYRIEAGLVSKERLSLFALGYKFEDFFRNFSNLNNEVLLKDLLMNEPVLKPGVEAFFRYLDENKIEKEHGQCELRIYETGLVIITGEGNFIRIPHSAVASVRVENYNLVINTDYGESYLFSKMGPELDKCYKVLSDSLNKLGTKIQLSLKELFPAYDSSVIRKVSRLMKDGRAARRIDIEAVSSSLWAELEKKLEVLGIREEYEYLKSLAQPQRMCIGIKRGLMGELTGEYIWFLAPVFSSDPAKPGNAIAMEAASVGESGKATYFFRISDRDKYLNLKTPEALDAEVDEAIKRINRHLITVNFRREPIYLSGEQLNSVEYVGYRRTITRVPSLQELRRIFIGRVMHRSPDQWREGVMKLLTSYGIG